MFDFAEDPVQKLPSYKFDDINSWQPMGFWVDQPRVPSDYNPLETGYLERTFGMPTYVGDTRVNGGSEALTTIASVLGSSWAGIDKQNQAFGADVYDFVRMTFASYDTGSKLVHNYGVQGQSFWYDIFPQILFTRLYDLYPDTPYMKEMVLNGADQWLESLPYFVKEGKPDYEFVGFDVVLKSPTVTGAHIEPPNGGLAFLFYAAYEITKEEKYLNGAKEVLDYLQTYNRNPNYEALTDYAPLVAAVLNADHGTHYDIGKFLDFLFDEDSYFRPGWSVMNGNLGSYSSAGLVGQAGDYAFSMNSFHLATVMAPLVKYDPRYAGAVGKYILNLVNNARIFFPQEIPLSHQAMDSYLPFDKKGSVAYEGFRNNYNSVSGYAMGDATTIFTPRQPSDLSIYSSAFIGGLGSIVSETNVKGILKVDLNATDSFGDAEYPYYMFYNPYDEDKIIAFEYGDGYYDLFDVSCMAIAASNVTGKINISVPAKESRVFAVLPSRSAYMKNSLGEVTVEGKVIARPEAAVNLDNITTNQQLTSSSHINISSSAPENDEAVNMKIYFGEILAYDGEPIGTFSYDKSILPDTDYTLKVSIVTSRGYEDYVTKKVVCR